MSPKRPSPRSTRSRSKTSAEQFKNSSEKEHAQPAPPVLAPALQEAIHLLGLDPRDSQRVEEVLFQLVSQGLVTVSEKTGIDMKSKGPAPKQPLKKPLDSVVSESQTTTDVTEGSEKSTSGPKRNSRNNRNERKPEKAKLPTARSFPSHVKGIIRKHPRGFGFVAPQDCPSIQEVFVPKQATAGAMDGDLVEVEIAPASIASPKGPEGHITAVLERSRQYLMGFVVNEDHAWIRGLEDFSGVIQMRLVEGIPVTIGDRVLLRMEQWPDVDQDQEGIGIVERVIGSIEDPSKDIDCAIAEFQLRPLFDPDVMQEAQAWGDRVQTKDLEGREDLREMECVTIDPTTAKDFDDALSVVKTSKGSYHLGVHIADVAYYVRSGSSLDREARRRCNSTYFPGRCVPMLPHELSDNLCSLKPDVNRLAVTVFMEFSPEGEMKRYRIARTVIRSAKRFTYEEALHVIEGKKRSKYKATLDLMVELCGLLKKKRADRGSVELALSDVQVCVNKDGIPTGLERHEYDITHQMVEEFMLKANEVVAAHLTKQGKPVAYRIHEAPGDADLKEFVATARALGFTIPMPPANTDLQALFAAAKESPHAGQLAVSFIKSMKLAYYSPDNIGHYGLGLEHYCHFTSPIRRYSDLIAQRALFGESETNLAEMTEACSEQERKSSRAEESVVRLKKLRLLKSWLDEDPTRAFPAIITRVKPNGVTFEIADLMLEGFLHVRSLGKDYYHFHERRMAFIGERSHEIFSYGQTIAVHVDALDLVTGELSWTMGESKDRPVKQFSTEEDAEDDHRARAPRRAKGHGRRSYGKKNRSS